MPSHDGAPVALSVADPIKLVQINRVWYVTDGKNYARVERATRQEEEQFLEDSLYKGRMKCTVVKFD
jgi:hypothetical protein